MEKRPGHARPGERLERSSEERHEADALALGADEGRDKLRKAAGRGKYPSNRGCPNGGTRPSQWTGIARRRR